jgi:hypothetical protein
VPSHLRPDIPLVIIGNIPEAAYDFLRLAGDEIGQMVRVRQLKSERSLLWAGSSKLVMLSFPAPHMPYLRERLGYDDTECIAPETPTAWLSRDSLRERSLIDRLVDYAGRERTLQLIPYATTRAFFELASALRAKHGLKVMLPESPSPENLWLRDLIDTKSGFHNLVGCWLPSGKLPTGIICRNAQVAADAVRWFLANGQNCLAKPDRGQAGIGIHLFSDRSASKKDILRKLQQNPFLRAESIIVEAFVRSSEAISPSLEFYVPPLESGPPEITYLSNQVIVGAGDFTGVLVGREIEQAVWYPAFRESGIHVAERLQAMGYVGHFDIDAIVDDEGQIYLVEINTRRTGGTHVHEFGLFAVGESYLDEVVLLSQDAMPSGTITDAHTLLEVLGDLLYPISGDNRGVVVTMTSTLPARKFGCIFVAATTDEAIALQESVAQRMQYIPDKG